MSAYFEKQYYEKHPNAPSFCVTCNNGKLFGIDIKINNNNPVYICKNHKCSKRCKHALCSSCYNKMNILNNENIAKKRKRIRNPTDVYKY